ncbi:hypothetical protein PG993_005270 [Apiospora rasikravindrae]|uniref:Uncharacterized protein n=1 Tax=Apiospora rasikravindrae TaxID=990691 RepID=A0ABR1TH11_9PEZI
MPWGVEGQLYGGWRVRSEAGESEIWCESSARSRISRGHGRQKWVRLCEEKSGVDERWLFRSGAGRCSWPTNECRGGGAPETISVKGTWRLRPITAGIVTSLSALCFDQVAKVAVAGKQLHPVHPAAKGGDATIEPASASIGPRLEIARRGSRQPVLATVRYARYDTVQLQQWCALQQQQQQQQQAVQSAGRARLADAASPLLP